MSLAGTDGLQVVKVGGSLCQPELLPEVVDWLEREAGLGPMLVVCGGGRYADTVRTEQQRLGLSDLTAHRQALLCMEQTAWLLQAAWQLRHQRTWPVSADLVAGRLWTPRQLLPDHPAVAADWQMTSDSLAAWVAGQVGASRLTLLKALPCGRLDADPGAGALQHWVDAGWVDARFVQQARGDRLQVCLLGQQAWRNGVGARTACATAAT